MGLKLKESWLDINPSWVSPEGEDEGFLFFKYTGQHNALLCLIKWEGEKGTGTETFVCQIPPVPGPGAYEALCVVLPPSSSAGQTLVGGMERRVPGCCGAVG